MEQGLAKGLKQGAQQMAIKIATDLLDVLDDATIAAKTGLSKADVARLRI